MKHQQKKWLPKLLLQMFLQQIQNKLQKVSTVADRRQPRDFKKNTRRPVRRESRVKPEFDQKIINIRRVARVVTGGRRFSFSVAIVAGNRKGMVGWSWKGGDTSLAIEKSIHKCSKEYDCCESYEKSVYSSRNFCKVLFVSYYSHARTRSRYDRRIFSSNCTRTRWRKDVGAKVRSGSKNKLNIARATVVALTQLSKPSRKRLLL